MTTGLFFRTEPHSDRGDLQRHPDVFGRLLLWLARLTYSLFVGALAGFALGVMFWCLPLGLAGLTLPAAMILFPPRFLNSRRGHPLRRERGHNRNRTEPRRALC